jgi:murein DD-endopeptidase MepM/ murein hydrolase activator NlpD
VASDGRRGHCAAHTRFENIRLATLKNTLLIALQSSLASLRQVVQHYPRGFSIAAFILLLLGGGAYALAAAVVTLAPDVSKLPVREVSESVAPLPLQPQSQALDTHRYTLYRSDVTRSNDTAENLLHRLGINDPDASGFLRREALAYRWLLGRSGRNLTAEASDDNKLIKLVARWSQADDGHFSRLVIEKTPSGFVSRLEAPPLTASTRIASGTIESSLFASTDEAQIPDSVAIQLAEIFSGDIDFHRELRKGDRYSVVYEVLEGDGEPLRAGRVLSAEFINAGKTYQAVWYQEPTTPDASPTDDDRPTFARGHSGYYTLEGQSLRRIYLSSPLAFSRVTSGFKMRFHPIRKQWIRHLGVDYAAPTGTPVRTIGDGTVEFAGVKGGFGNVIFVRHRNSHVTVYAHLSRIYVRRGQRVEQGQRIGAVGATGWATGPHLHFEFRINGHHQNPLAIARKSETRPLPASARPAFARMAAIARQELGAAPLLQAAR